MPERLEEAFDWIFGGSVKHCMDISFPNYWEDIAVWLKVVDEVCDIIDWDWQTREHANGDELWYLQVVSFLNLIQKISDETNIQYAELFTYFFFTTLRFQEWKKYLIGSPIGKNTDRSYYFDTKDWNIHYVP